MQLWGCSSRSEVFRLHGERDDAADQLAKKGRWERARAWYEDDEAVARRNTAMADAQQLELQHKRDAAGLPPTAMQIAQTQRQAGAAVRDGELRHEAVRRNDAMRRQRGGARVYGSRLYGMAPVDSDSDEEQFCWYRKRHSELLHGSAPTLGSAGVVRPAASESDNGDRSATLTAPLAPSLRVLLCVASLA